MIVYRLVTPVDEFDDLLTLPEYLAAGSAEASGWALTALLALADAADQVGWRGDMRHLPSVGPSDTSAGDPCLIVKQDDLGATFAVAATPPRWLFDQYGSWSVHIEVPDREIPHATHPTAAQIAEAMDYDSGRQPDSEADLAALCTVTGDHPF